MFRLASFGVMLLGLILTGCARPKPMPSPPPTPTPAAPPAKQNLFVLLPDPGPASRVFFSNSAGTAELAEANTAIRVERADASPSQVFRLSDAEAQKLFSDALSVLPMPAVTFVLHFQENRDVLTGEALQQIGAVLEAIRERRSTSISITGHTDTTGSVADNHKLGLRRARSVAALLLKEGVSPDNLVITSHGENNPLIQTPDNTDEPKNRRVEVIVR